MIHRILVEGRVCYPCAAMQLAAVVIHRMLWLQEEPALPMPETRFAVVIHKNALVAGRVCYPCAVMQAAVMIHRCSGGKKGVLSLRCHAESSLLYVCM
jgi:hypothetical protein